MKHNAAPFFFLPSKLQQLSDQVENEGDFLDDLGFNNPKKNTYDGGS